jgi:hypothetical protein
MKAFFFNHTLQCVCYDNLREVPITRRNCRFVSSFALGMCMHLHLFCKRSDIQTNRTNMSDNGSVTLKQPTRLSCWWSYMMIIYEDHIGSSKMMIIYDDHVWWSHRIIMYDDHIWSPCKNDHIWWSYMIIMYDHIWWSCMMSMYDGHIW